MNNKIVLACDLGGTNLRMAAIASNGKILHRLKADTPKDGTVSELVRSIVGVANECRNAVKEAGKIKALAAAVPATINVKEGIISKAPNIPALDGFRFISTISAELNLPVLLENDANSAAIGEQVFGAARGYQNTISVTLGTGVGGGIVIDGKILRGIDGTAGEIGHICVEPFGEPCGCGSRGCLEQYSSATAIVRIVRDLENQYPKSLFQKKSRLSSIDVYKAGTDGDELALEVFRRMGFYLGVAIGNLVNVLNPGVIVIGGGASEGWDLFIKHVNEEVNKRAFREPAKRVRIVRAGLVDDAGILGAAHLAFNSLNKSFN
jgi:glucokinase